MNEHLSTTSSSWPAMWDALAAVTGDYADCNPASAECWQYMGTHDGQHQFRHRHRPNDCQNISGFAGRHVDRVYVDLDAETLKPTRVNAQAYPSRGLQGESGPIRLVVVHPEPPAALADSRAIGERTEAGREQNRINRDDSFDYMSVSDADPGL